MYIFVRMILGHLMKSDAKKVRTLKFQLELFQPPKSQTKTIRTQTNFEPLAREILTVPLHIMIYCTKMNINI